MKKFEPLEFITVDVKGTKHKVYRAELLENPKIADILTNFERAAQEGVDLEYQVKLVAHARRSMSQELQQVVGQYVIDKISAEDNKESEEESADE